MSNSSDTPSVVFTEIAARTAKESLIQNNMSDCGLRLSIVGGGCSGYEYQMQPIGLDDIRVTDNRFVFGDLTVVIDCASLTLLEGTTVDYKTTLQNSGFVFINPNAKRKCGCGHSFS
jgi:iron-sulfur cluster assembly protein